MPPDAEPVTPASVVTVIASLTSGSGIAINAFLMTMNPGSAAITAPKPYSDAVFIDASSAPPIAAFVPSANFRRDRTEREHEHGDNARQQRAHDRPDRGHCGKLRHERLREPGELVVSTTGS